MAYFHDKWVRNRGGLKRRPMRRLIGETVEEMQSVVRRWPEATTITWPPRSHDSFKSKSLPMILVDADRTDILEELQSAEVDENYLRVLTFMLRERIYGERLGHTDETRKFFATEVRGNLIRLLKEGSWIDEPENLGLKNLNARLEKLDLGRRSDLNFSSNQSEILKYDRDIKQSRGESFEQGVHEMDLSEMDWSAKYRDGTKATREDILRSRPWMRRMLMERYGEP